MFDNVPPAVVPGHLADASHRDLREKESRTSLSSGRVTSEDCGSSTATAETATSSLSKDESIHHNLSTLQLLVVHIGAALTLFLATTDATIVSTSLPTITSDLRASPNQYTWVGVAYMLTQTAFQPLYGRVSDLVGRKNVLYVSMFIFALGSALCGAAQSINWLIAARALGGIGGGGIVSAVWVITAEVVEVRKRAIWSQALSITWSASAIAGPIIGGIFSGQNASRTGWRWGFYINLPICLFSFTVLFWSLRGIELNKPSNASWKTLRERFDFFGLALFMSGTSCIIIGFSFATELGWKAPSTLALIIIGTCILICGGFYERHTTRDSLFPATTFRDITTISILVISFFHNFAFTAGTFYLALFYQAANGDTPLESGMKLLPYSLGSSIASMPTAWFIAYWQRRTHNTSGQNKSISIGLFVSTLGFALLNLLDEKSGIATEIVYPLIAGIGIGMLFHAPYQVFTRALKKSEIATGTSAFFLVRFTGATVGLAVAGTIFYSHAASRLPADLQSTDGSSFINYSAIRHLPTDQKQEVLRVISASIRLIWTTCAPILAVAFLISLTMRVIPDYEDAEIPANLTTSKTQSLTSSEVDKV